MLLFPELPPPPTPPDSNLAIRKCNLVENSDKEELRADLGVDGALEGKVDSDRSDADAVKGEDAALRGGRLCGAGEGDGEVGRDVFFIEERIGGGGSAIGGAESLLRCCNEVLRMGGALRGNAG